MDNSDNSIHSNLLFLYFSLSNGETEIVGI